MPKDKSKLLLNSHFFILRKYEKLNSRHLNWQDDKINDLYELALSCKVIRFYLLFAGIDLP